MEKTMINFYRIDNDKKIHIGKRSTTGSQCWTCKRKRDNIDVDYKDAICSMSGMWL